MFSKNETIEDRFWNKVKILKENDCWEWKYCKDKDGYGGFELTHGNKQRAHRVSWELNYGPIPANLFVLHHCDNPSCVNPKHLFLGSASDNNKDCKNKGRARGGGVKGEKNKMAKLTEKQVIEIREKYIPYKYSTYQLAKEYGMHASQIHKIVRNENWKISR